MNFWDTLFSSVQGFKRFCQSRDILQILFPEINLFRSCKVWFYARSWVRCWAIEASDTVACFQGTSGGVAALAASRGELASVLQQEAPVPEAHFLLLGQRTQPLLLSASQAIWFRHSAGHCGCFGQPALRSTLAEMFAACCVINPKT